MIQPFMWKVIVLCEAVLGVAATVVVARRWGRERKLYAALTGAIVVLLTLATGVLAYAVIPCLSDKIAPGALRSLPEGVVHEFAANFTPVMWRDYLAGKKVGCDLASGVLVFSVIVAAAAGLACGILSSVRGTSLRLTGKAMVPILLVVGTVLGLVASQYFPVFGGIETLGAPWSQARKGLIGVHVISFGAVGAAIGLLLVWMGRSDPSSN